jgi:hypothetical protein
MTGEIVIQQVKGEARGQERYASGRDAANRHTQRSEPRERVAAAVVSVEDIEALHFQSLTEPEKTIPMDGIARRQRKHMEEFFLRPLLKRAPRGTDEELFVPPLAQSTREEQQLLLAAAQVEPRIDMSNLHQAVIRKWIFEIGSSKLIKLRASSSVR